MKSLAFGCLGTLLGYLLAAAAGWALVQLFSTNTHDKSLELAMTSLVVAGPLGAVLGLLAGALIGWTSTCSKPPDPS